LANKVKVVLNRVGTECDITIKKAEETIGKPIFWQIPNDSKAMIESRTPECRSCSMRPNARLNKASPGIAQILSGAHETIQTPSKKARTGFV